MILSLSSPVLVKCFTVYQAGNLKVLKDAASWRCMERCKQVPTENKAGAVSQVTVLTQTLKCFLKRKIEEYSLQHSQCTLSLPVVGKLKQKGLFSALDQSWFVKNRFYYLK